MPEAKLQFAIAGMNAHINHDLALALLRTSNERSDMPDRGSPQHRDFERVNLLLERNRPPVSVFPERLLSFLRGCSTPMGQESLTADEVAIAEASIDFNSLRRFLHDVPDLRRLLAAPARGEQELLLREAMRRAFADLAAVLDDAARVEEARERAAVLRRTSLVASELAECGLSHHSADH